jgi:type I restriction enzyme S subunit
VLNQHIFKVDPFEDWVDPVFLFWGLKKVIQEMWQSEHTHGSTMKHINRGPFLAHAFPLPPLPEQQRIAAKLRELMEKVDVCRKRLEPVPRLVKQFRQSVLAAACVGRLTADWRLGNVSEGATALLKKIEAARRQRATSNKEKSQIDEAFANSFQNAAELPETWTFCTIGAIGNVSNGSTPSRKVNEFWGGDIPWASSGEVRNNVISKTRESINNKASSHSFTKVFPRGTVLLAMIGEGKTRGQSAILDIASTINQNIAAIDISHGYLASAYLWRWFQYQYETTREAGSGSGPQALNCQRVRELPFHLPPLEEQLEIVRRVDSLFNIADAVEGYHQQAQEQLDKLRQSILTKAFRGELVPQDPQDEPESALLERIRDDRRSLKASSTNY